MRPFRSRLLLPLAALVMLTACGESDTATTPTSPAPPTTAPTVSIAVSSSPTASPAASAIASPAATPIATPIASPASGPLATPMGSPMASPQASPVAGRATSLVQVHGTVVLPGSPNVDYVLTEHGCVGIGSFRGLKAGRQVVIRNASGTILTVASLEPVKETLGCRWTFTAAVPSSSYYVIEIPMVVEVVIPRAAVYDHRGNITIEIP